MPLLESHISEVLRAVAREGTPQLSLAPIEEAGPKCPPSWRELLQLPDPRQQLFSVLWGPLAEKLPLTIAAFRQCVQGIGFLTTRKRPPSLVYFYSRGNQAFAYRGFAPRIKQRPESTRLPNEFLQFYMIHDGFVDLFSFALGPLPEQDWFFLSDDPSVPAGSFLAVFSNGGGANLGYDFSEHQPLAYIVWPDEPPTVLPDVWPTIDEWISSGLDGADPA